MLYCRQKTITSRGQRGKVNIKAVKKPVSTNDLQAINRMTNWLTGSYTSNAVPLTRSLSVHQKIAF